MSRTFLALLLLDALIGHLEVAAVRQMQATFRVLYPQAGFIDPMG